LLIWQVGVERSNLGAFGLNFSLAIQYWRVCSILLVSVAHIGRRFPE